jgi:hypothetical protein
MRIFSKVLILLVLLVNLYSCWWDAGHMIVAKIAQLTLLEEG